eukprot:1161105-Pelagomonas_calceolata.AAC.17
MSTYMSLGVLAQPDPARSRPPIGPKTSSCNGVYYATAAQLWVILASRVDWRAFAWSLSKFPVKDPLGSSILLYTRVPQSSSLSGAQWHPPKWPS